MDKRVVIEGEGLEHGPAALKEGGHAPLGPERHAALAEVQLAQRGRERAEGHDATVAEELVAAKREDEHTAERGDRRVAGRGEVGSGNTVAH